MKVLIKNKKARFNYEIIDTFVAGISLFGPEVKSLKSGNGSMDGAYVLVNSPDKNRGESEYKTVLRGLTIPPYQAANTPDWYLADRDRTLLLSKKEIDKLVTEKQTARMTIVPLAVGLAGNKIKVELALVRGKKQYDKRETIKKRDTTRDMDRTVKRSYA